MITLMVPPPVLPYAASDWNDSTLRCVTASMGGLLVSTPEPLAFGAPSIRSSLVAPGAPPTEKSDVWLLSKGRVRLGPPSGVTPDHNCAIIIGVRPSTG